MSSNLASPTNSSDPDTGAVGVLPSQALRALIAGRAISADGGIPGDLVQPASVDLRLGVRGWRVRASFLPGPGRSVQDCLALFSMHPMDLRPGAVLEKGCVYVIELAESLHLPEGLTAVANAKSSTGRLDLFTRLITDRGAEFDRVEPGYTGPLYAEITPRSFSVLVRPGVRLNQMRLRRGQVVIGDSDLVALNDRHALVDGPAHIDQGLGFSVDLRPARADTPVGWRARPHAGLIDLEQINHYPVQDFWEPIHAESGRIILDPGAFYILVSREAVHIPPDLAAEMAPYLAMAGEFRVHYAGFFDPGFGHHAAGGRGARGVLEVRCHEAPFALEHGQIVGRLVYEQMAEVPDVLYGAGLKSNYQGQGLKLSKHFRSPDPG